MIKPLGTNHWAINSQERVLSEYAIHLRTLNTEFLPYVHKRRELTYRDSDKFKNSRTEVCCESLTLCHVDIHT